MKYRKPGDRSFEIIGEVERVSEINGSYFVYIVTSKKHEKRYLTRIEAPINKIKEFIPFLYQNIKAQFIKGCVFVTLLNDKQS